MSVIEQSGSALALHADTESATIVVAVDGPVDDLVLARIDAALRPFMEVRSFTVRLDHYQDVREREACRRTSVGRNMTPRA